VNNSFDPAAVTYEWRDAQNVIVGTNAQTLVITATGLYTVKVISNGCSGSDNETFSSIACQIQKGISVNNDGLNDVFDLTGFNVKKLTIFNRYGLIDYSKSSYTNQWHGQTDSGDDLPDGTYYYVLERDNGETKTGWVYINRAQ
jgi:gliding motility-associated-like protein